MKRTARFADDTHAHKHIRAEVAPRDGNEFLTESVPERRYGPRSEACVCCARDAEQITGLAAFNRYGFDEQIHSRIEGEDSLGAKPVRRAERCEDDGE